MTEDIEDSFQAAIDAGKINGAVLCASDAEGRFVYEKAMGERTLVSGEKKPQQLDDVLYLASATKLITTIAALQCVEDGLLTLTADLSSILPELAAQQVITGFSDDGETPLLAPEVRPITLEMLLTHSSGATYSFANPHVARWREKFANPKDEGKRSVAEIFSYPLAFQPGTGWMYGTGVDWAGVVVERVTGLTLCERMQQRIFAPLGISDAQFYPVTRENLRARLVDLNPQDPEAIGRAVLGEGADLWNRHAAHGDFGGHGLFMTGTDYGKILRSLLANDSKILQPATIDDMFQHHLNPEATASHRAALAGPMGSFYRAGSGQDGIKGYGLGGLLTLQDVDGWYGERTMTWGGALTITWFIDRKNNLCAMGAVQSAIPMDVAVVTHLKDIFSHDIYRKNAAWKDQQKSS